MCLFYNAPAHALTVSDLVRLLDDFVVYVFVNGTVLNVLDAAKLSGFLGFSKLAWMTTLPHKVSIKGGE